ncbi:hypothetical protein [Brevibacterium aurantiacum]|uniref:Uncharacterized protein n=1 Tax=Brevibacterium aurantiacum TaxID=273384 RepID=A0A556C4R2_BREAU|nr:hypothetical protein [Brevibacterium aurantiacum]TSI12463.1 hypothetical protein FO013_20240 [Brevibacterium aurantiacum]
MGEKELIMYVGGPLNETVKELTPREDEDNCRGQLGGWYRAAGTGEHGGQFARRREWITGERPPWTPTPESEIDGIRD